MCCLEFSILLLLCFVQIHVVISQLIPNDTGRTCDRGFFDNGNLCLRCPKGTTSSRGSFQCSTCPNGTYLDLSGTTCSPCFAGEFIDSNLSCKLYPRGTYSEVQNAASCTKCPSNTTVDFEGAFEASLCEGCRPGYGYGGLGSNSDNLCGLCEAGSYQDQDPGLDCIPCPPGTGSNEEDEANPIYSSMWTSIDECRTCRPGTYSKLQFGIRNCVPCPNGSIAPKNGTEECMVCPSGSVSVDSGLRCAEEVSEGNNCPIGTERNGFRCVPCPNGTVRVKTVQKTCVRCRNGFVPSAKKTRCVCPSHKIIDKRTKKCIECPERSVRVNKTTCRCELPFINLRDRILRCVCPFHSRRKGLNCVACSERELAQSVKRRPGDCTLCRKDKIFNPATGKCDNCPTGTESPFGRIARKCRRCKPRFKRNGVFKCGCPKGSIIRNNKCRKCPPGTASNRLNGCDDCFAPFFSDVPGLRFCKRCPKGQRHTTTGGRQKKCPSPCPANSKTDGFECECNSRFIEKRVNGKLVACTRCPRGSKADVFHLNCVCKKGFALLGKKCKKCPVGSFSSDGLRCKQCDERSFSRGRGNPKCNKCRPGAFSLLTGGKKCIFCKKGSFITRKGNCGRCKPGFRVRNGRCVKCINSVSSGGDVGYCVPCRSGMVPNKNNSRCMMSLD